jgi:PAS domain S-box-containing protein
MEELLEYSREEFLDKELWEIGVLRDKEESVAAFVELQTKDYIRYEDLPLKTKRGERREVEFVSNVYSENGRQVIQCNIRDITARKFVEEEIKKLHEILQQRTIKLEAANKELEAFSYSVSHDLRAPLRAIDGFSRALLQDYSDKIDEAGQDYLARVCAASQKMAQLIDDLLNLSRLTRSEINYKSVDLGRIADEIAEKLHEGQPERKVKFKIEEKVMVRGDERLLRIALQNLFDNAWKFTSKRERAEISFGHTRHNGQIEYFVRDNGAGFNMAYADKLFGVFQRLHTVQEFEGTGIGLVTVQRIVIRHGGLIRAEGKVDEGAAFYFTI